MRLSGTEDPLVGSGMIDVAEIPTKAEAEAFLIEGGDTAYVYSRGDDNLTISGLGLGGKKALVMTRGTVDIDSSFEGLVVAGGDVTVSKDFKGLILTTGKISVNGNPVNMQSNPVLVKRLLSYALGSEDYYKVFRAMEQPETHNPTDLSECFKYENWEKNSY